MKEDLRITKTRKVLFETLVLLMKEKSFEEIKVSDICKKALINRSTFYSHYQDIYALLEEFEDEILDMLDNAFEDNLTESLNNNDSNVYTREYFIDLIKLLLDHIDEKKDIYYSILLNNRNSIVIDIIVDVVSKDINNRLINANINNNGVPSEIISKFYLGAVASVGIEYLSSKNKYKKEDMINYIDKLIPENINN